MDQENIMICKGLGESYPVVDLCQSRFYEYKDSYNYYDIDVDKILLFKKNSYKYFIRYYVVNRMKLVPLQLKIKNSYSEIRTYANNNEVMLIHSDDKELFRKCREIWDKIIELIGINNPRDFVETTLDDEADEFITADVNKNKSLVRGNYRNNKVVTVLHSVIIYYVRASLVQ